jgi:hypothetical protein
VKISNFDQYNIKRHIAVGKAVQLDYRKPLSLNDTYSYLKTAFKLELEQTDFYFSDQQMQAFLGFVMMIRLLNNIRSFIKKFVYEMGKDDCDYLDKELLKLYDYQSASMVESTLVPNVSVASSRCPQRSRSISSILSGT